jgi:hypothetical protein
LIFLVLLVTVLAPFAPSQQRPQPERDSRAIEVLSRVIRASGAANNSIPRDIRETGEVVFHWGNGVRGPVTVSMMGGDRLRLDAELPRGKSTWIVRESVGSKRDAQGQHPIGTLQSVNLGFLTFPLAYALEAINDPTTDVSLGGIEQQSGRSIYRLKLRGRLGLSQKEHAVSVTKYVLVDAMTFDVIAVEEHPVPISMHDGKRVEDSRIRRLDFGDFRLIHGLRVPFLISESLFGQSTLDIHLTDVSFNNNLPDEDFKNSFPQ